MFSRSLLPARARKRRAHYLFAAALFGILGFHVGVWAVQLAPLSAGLGLDPAALGVTVAVAAAAGLVTLFVLASFAADGHVSARQPLLAASVGRDVDFLALAFVLAGFCFWWVRRRLPG